MAFQVKKAIREKIYAKIALMAPSGAGKSYSALRLATGMKAEIEKNTGKKARILMGNSEQKRGYYYANEFDYDIVDIDAPHEPEKYVDLISFAMEEGYDILIIDSSSHEWEGKGGCLEIHQKAGGRYQDWGKVSPRHDRFINAIADSKMHVIATMRGKDQYVMSQEEGRNGNKTKVEKVGVGAKQRDGFEYEFTCTFLIDQKTSTAETFKDNTHIFENEPSVKLTEEHGKKIIQWANSGEGYTEKSRNNDSEDLKSKLVSINEIAVELAGTNKKEVVEIIKEYHKKSDGTGNANYNSITNIDIANKVLDALNELKNKINNKSNQEENINE
jgi:hypothetical protein